MIMVLIYQIIIFSIVVAVKGNRLVLGVLCLWTMTHVFMPWLMILQLMTIMAGVHFGKRFRQNSAGRKGLKHL